MPMVPKTSCSLDLAANFEPKSRKKREQTTQTRLLQLAIGQKIGESKLVLGSSE